MALFEELDRSFERPKLTMGESLESSGQFIALGRRIKLDAAGLRQPKREAAAVIGIGRAVDQAGPDERIDRAADRRRAARNRFGDLAQGRGLCQLDGAQ